jgi:hypothetical protein
MPIQCPNCSVSAGIGIDGQLTYIGGQCLQLMGTPFVHQFERCPILAAAMGRDVKDLPVHSEKIDRVIFRPVFENSAWEIEALCPNSVIERIRGFESEAESRDWIASRESRSWLRARGYLQSVKAVPQ